MEINQGTNQGNNGGPGGFGAPQQKPQQNYGGGQGYGGQGANMRQGGGQGAGGTGDFVPGCCFLHTCSNKGIHIDSRVRYAWLLFYIAPMCIIMLLAKTTPETLIEVFDSILTCNLKAPVGGTVTDEDKAICIQTLLMIRIAWVYFLMEFIVVMFLTSSDINLAKGVNEGFWLLKTFVLAALTFAFCYVSNDFFEVVTEIGKYCAVIFLVAIMIVFIDFLYRWGVAWRDIANGSDENITKPGDPAYRAPAPIFFAVMLFFTLIMYGTAIFLMIKNWNWFYWNGQEEECGKQKFILLFNCIWMVVCTVLTIASLATGINKDSSIITSGGITWMIWFLTFAGLTYSEQPECNEWIDSTQTFWVKWSIWFVLFVICVIGGNFAFRENDPNNPTTAQGKFMAYKVKPQGVRGAGQPYGVNDNEESYTGSARDWLTFHAVMVLGGCAFLLMIMTNWIAIDYAFYSTESKTAGKTYHTETAMWIFAVISWLTAALYCWSIYAP